MYPVPGTAFLVVFDMNVGSLLPWHARNRPHHVALICGETRLTFAELEDRVNRLANALAALVYAKATNSHLFSPTASSCSTHIEPLRFSESSLFR